MKLCFVITVVGFAFFVIVDAWRKSGLAKDGVVHYNIKSGYSGRTQHGSVTDLNPTGMKGGGVPASEKAAKYDFNEVNKRRNCYQDAADAYGLQASVIAALASRESDAGLILYATNGYGDHGNAYGILQCDIRHSGLDCLKYKWDSCDHMNMMVSQLLVPYMEKVRAKFSNWTLSMTLQGGVAAYNSGVANVRSWANLDKGTTHNDYSNDAIARAKYYYDQGFN